MFANRWYFGALLAACLGAGCSTAPQMSYSGHSWHDVSGTVTLDGQPLKGAKVRFVGQDNIAASGVTDDGGRYQLRFDSNQSGITPGPKKVQIRTAVADESAADEKASVSKEKVPAKYNDKTELTADVGSGSTTFDFKLSSK